MVKPSNYVVLATMHAQRKKLNWFGASMLRYISWMIMSGGYELDTSLVLGKYGGFAPRDRLEALGVLNNAPKERGGDLNLVAIVFCGCATASEHPSAVNILARAPFERFEDIEEMGLNDAEFY